MSCREQYNQCVSQCGNNTECISQCGLFQNLCITTCRVGCGDQLVQCNTNQRIPRSQCQQQFNQCISQCGNDNSSFQSIPPGPPIIITPWGPINPPNISPVSRRCLNTNCDNFSFQFLLPNNTPRNPINPDTAPDSRKCLNSFKQKYQYI